MRLAVVFMVLVLLAACSDGEADGLRPEAPIGPGTTSLAAINLPSVGEPDSPLLGLAVVEVASGFERPSLAIAPWGDDRLFITEQPGRVWVLEDDFETRELLVDISDLVQAGGLEQGLLGLAFHPAFPLDPRVFLHFTDVDGDSRLISLVVAGGDIDLSSRVEMLGVDQPATNHNGGMLSFGPDGYLYLGLGDGGGANDQFGHGQQADTLLGTILRLDVDGAVPYAIPPDNPFVAGGGAPEVWAYGLRNPWRFDFDPVTGTLFVADVGQADWEEVSVLPTGSSGANLGWSILEGTECFEDQQCSSDGLVTPAVVYGHGEGCSVTGGFVYRGASIPELTGHFFYADWCSGWVRSFLHDGASVVDQRDWSTDLGDLGRISSFGRDGSGELYVVGTDGIIWRIEPVR